MEYYLHSQFWWLVSLVIPLAVGLYAHFRVTGAYHKYAQISSHSGMTGRDAAAVVLERAGITNVSIREIGGEMTDHYDPEHRTLALSSENYHGTSLAAIGVSAHEAGHAIQHKQGYAPMNFRMGLVPSVNAASMALPFVMIGGFLFGRAGGWLLDLGIGCYLAITLFHLVTLPVEFDASNRAKVQLAGAGIADASEMTGIRDMLDAAGFTYVASFLASILNLIYLIVLRNEEK
jgi:Zn-dependent membrane protease YugP